MIKANKAIIRRLFEECLNQHNTDRYFQLYGDVVYYAPAIGVLRGEAHRQFLISVFASFPDAHWTVEHQIAESDLVVTRWTFRGSHLGTFMGMAPTGNAVSMHGISIDRVADAKIVEEWEEWDTLGFTQQLAATAAVTIGDMVAP
jgi:steroid delta-isomerase-like uncharacterized protein